MKMTAGRAWAYVGTAVGVTCSLAANVAHAYVRPTTAELPKGALPPGQGLGQDYQPDGIVIAGHAVWPLIFFIAVETAARNDWQDRRIGQACLWFVGVVAAYLSWGHMYEVFRSWGWSEAESAVGPLGVDGLMVMCAAALSTLRSDSTSSTESGSTDRAPDQPAPTTPDPAAVTPPSPAPREVPAAGSDPKVAPSTDAPSRMPDAGSSEATQRGSSNAGRVLSSAGGGGSSDVRSRMRSRRRTDDQLRLELTEAIRLGKLPERPSSKAIQTVLGVGQPKAQMLRDERADVPGDDPADDVPSDRDLDEARV